MIGLLNLVFFIILAILFVGVFAVVFILSKAQSFLRQLRGEGRSQSSRSYTYTNRGYTDQSSQSASASNVNSDGYQPKKKIIPQDEGEYVEFEEVE